MSYIAIIILFATISLITQLTRLIVKINTPSEDRVEWTLYHRLFYMDSHDHFCKMEIGKIYYLQYMISEKKMNYDKTMFIKLNEELKELQKCYDPPFLDLLI